MQSTKIETNKTPKSPKTPQNNNNNKTPQKNKFVKPLREEKKIGKPEMPGKVIEGKDKLQKRQTPNPSTQGMKQNNEAGLSRKKRTRKRQRSKSNERLNSENKPQQNNQNKTPDSEKKRKNGHLRSDVGNKKQKIDFDKSKPMDSNAKHSKMQLTKIETNKTRKSPKTPQNNNSNKIPQKNKFVKPLGEEKKIGKPETPGKVIEGKDKLQKRQTPNPSTQGMPQNNEAGLSRRERKIQRMPERNERTNSENKPQQNNQNKMPDSGKKKKIRRRSRAAIRKQKIDFDKSKPINSNVQNQQFFKDIKITFPRSNSSYKEAVLKVLLTCEAVDNMLPLTLKFKPEEVERKLEEIKKIEVDGKQLEALILDDNYSLKRVICLKVSGVDTDALKKIFNAKSIEQMLTERGTPTRMYVVTFASEESVAMACKNTYTLNGKECDLRPYVNQGYENKGNSNNSTNTVNNKKQNTRSDKQTPKNGKRKPKMQEEKDEEGELGSEAMADIDMDDDE